MNKRHPYNNIIERKLEQLPVADADHLWNDMHSILDKKMPQKKQRRRFIFWFLTGRGLILLILLPLAIASFFVLLFSPKQNFTVAINKLPATQQSDKSFENVGTKISPEEKGNIMTGKKVNQKNNNKVAVSAPLTIFFNNINNYKLGSPQSINHSEKYSSEHQINEPRQVTSKTLSRFDIVPFSLKPVYQDFQISTTHNKEIDSLIRTSAVKPADLTKSPGKNNESGMYAGIITGVDLSSIHFQSARPGTTKGFIVGYTFNEKWSIESGLYWATKRVYDNGTYFNPPGFTPTSGIKIIAVNAKSRLYELPVNIKYTITSGKHNLFATAGLSSYIMRSENYEYEYMQNNQPGGHNYLSYKNKTKDWFSVVNLSMGYTHKLSANGSLRVEPYLKLPLKNIGTGNLPVMSTGLNIGFTKPLRR